MSSSSSLSRGRFSKGLVLLISLSSKLASLSISIKRYLFFMQFSYCKLHWNVWKLLKTLESSLYYFVLDLVKYYNYCDAISIFHFWFVRGENGKHDSSHWRRSEHNYVNCDGSWGGGVLFSNIHWWWVSLAGTEGKFCSFGCSGHKDSQNRWYGGSWEAQEMERFVFIFLTSKDDEVEKFLGLGWEAMIMLRSHFYSGFW